MGVWKSFYWRLHNSLFFHDLSITLGTNPDPIKYSNIYTEHESADQTFSDIGFCQS